MFLSQQSPFIAVLEDSEKLIKMLIKCNLPSHDTTSYGVCYPRTLLQVGVIFVLWCQNARYIGTSLQIQFQ